MTVRFEAPGVVLHHGDCIEIMRTLPDSSVDAVVTDPPYGLDFMGREWDRYTPLAFEQWCAEWAAECYRLLKPGGHMLSFGGSRTWHRLAAGIEDAGFEIRDSIAWLYGSGFPKSLDVSKAIDRQRDEDRAPVDAVRYWLNSHRVAAGFSHDAVNKHFGHASNGGGSSSAWMTNPTSKALPTWEQWQELKVLLALPDEMDAEVARLNGRKGTHGEAWQSAEVLDVREGAMAGWSMDGSTRFVDREVKAANSDDARAWEGWGTALKPAFEPIVVARKPLTGTVAANVLAHGTGALNIDATRTATRWPTNVLLDESQAAELDAQSGTLHTQRPTAASTMKSSSHFGGGAASTRQNHRDDGDATGASRFFPTFHYEAKAPTDERPSVDGILHPTVKPLDLMRWLVRLVTPPNGTILEPFAGSGTTLEAALLEGFNVIGIEREADYLPLIEQRITKPLQVAMFGDWGETA